MESRREKLELRFIWGRVLTSMQSMQQFVGKLSKVLQNKGMFYNSTLNRSSITNCGIMGFTYENFQGIMGIVYKSRRLP